MKRSTKRGRPSETPIPHKATDDVRKAVGASQGEQATPDAPSQGRGLVDPRHLQPGPAENPFEDALPDAPDPTEGNPPTPTTRAKRRRKGSRRK